MNVFRISSWCMFIALVALGTTIGLNVHVAAQQASSPGEEGVEVLTRGPLHEAFAETISFDPQQGVVAPKAPPSDIDELTPPQRPEGTKLSWIPGYWAWDDERNDYLWLSGIWRALPPGRQWVPGYWGESQQGFQWISGYWADATASEIDYLPAPPATVEVGPNVAAPSAEDTWLPGCWVWQQNRYAWRAGYWTKGNQDWDWIPDHYVWTPSGYVFVDGYYDYSVARRGVVFAPVYFNAGRRSQRGYSYSPSTVINAGVFVSHLFLRPRYGHYYFGDYYGSKYADAGYSPWFSFQSSHRGYDPIYANRRWHHRRDRDWENRTESDFRRYRDNEDSRPPRTWAAQQALEASGAGSDLSSITVASSLDELVKRKDGRHRFQAVDSAEQQQFSSRGRESRKFREERQQLEANAAETPAVDGANSAQPARRKLARSPFVAMSADQLDVNNVPPKRQKVFTSDIQVQPQPVTRVDSTVTLQGDGLGTANEPLSQDPQVKRKFDSLDQSEGRRVKRSNSQDASNNQPRDRGGRRGKSQGESNAAQWQGKAEIGGQSQGASNHKSQDAPKRQLKDNSKKIHKD